MSRDILLASGQELRDLFAHCVNTAVRYGDACEAGFTPLPRFARALHIKDFAEYDLEIDRDNLPGTAQQAAGVLGLSGFFNVAAKGTLKQCGFSRTFWPDRCVFMVDQQPPPGAPDLYYRGYWLESDGHGGVTGHSEIVEDYIPPNETVESFMEAKALARLSGAITLAECTALQGLTSALKPQSGVKRLFRTASFTKIVLPFSS